MTTEDQDKAISALMASEGYVTAAITSIGVLGAVAITGEDTDGNYHFHTIGPDGWVPFHGYPAHEDVTP